MQLDLNEIRAVIMENIMKGRMAKAGKALGKGLAALEPPQYQEFYALFKDVLTAGGELFMDKGYFSMWRETRKWDPHFMLQFEQPFIEKYCLFPNEKILAPFCGSLVDNFVIISGRIYVTNYRIIATGLRIMQNKGAGFGGLVGAIAQVAMMSAFTKITKAIQRTLSMENVETLNYGFVYPYQNNYKLDLKKNGLSYRVNIEYEKNGKLKTEKMNVRLGTFRMKKQDKHEFQVYQEQLHNALYNIFSQVSDKTAEN
jgi:hypothetical protein